ncbi:protein eyes shut homolog isoform X1 [Amphiura filiformis]|uniref:protein eyes shut homolog isoform X1 n=1 Tax=Amphiura filiformis TaxID=82378 RepID=UPI003B20B65F
MVLPSETSFTPPMSSELASGSNVLMSSVTAELPTVGPSMFTLLPSTVADQTKAVTDVVSLVSSSTSKRASSDVIIESTNLASSIVERSDVFATSHVVSLDASFTTVPTLTSTQVVMSSPVGSAASDFITTSIEKSLVPSGLPVTASQKSLEPSEIVMTSIARSLQPSGVLMSSIPSSLKPSDLPVTSILRSLQPSGIPMISTTKTLEPSGIPLSSTPSSLGPSSFPVTSILRSLQPSDIPMISSAALTPSLSPTPSLMPQMSSRVVSISPTDVMTSRLPLSSLGQSTFVRASPSSTQSILPTITPSASMVPPTVSQLPTTQFTTTQPTATKPTAPPTCRDGLCQNGGTCMDTTSSEGVVMAECDCLWNFTGRFCQKELAVSFPAFNGNSYLTHQAVDFSQSTTNRLYLSVKTPSTDGTLAYSVSNPSNPVSDFLHLFLDDGFVVYEFSCGLGDVFRVRSTLRVNTDELITILVIQNRPVDFSSLDCSATLTIGGQTFTSAPHLSFIAPSPLGPLYLGGLPLGQSPIAMATQVVGFVGCIRHLQVNHNEYVVFDDAEDGRNIAECEVANPCLYDPCRNGGNCTVTSDDEWLCECPKHLGGDLCERPINLCEGNPCHRGATCISVPEQFSFACLCPYGTAGLICNETIEIPKPLYSGIQYGYMSYIRYARVLNWDFMLHLRLKFTLENVNHAITNNLLLYSGQRGSHGDDYLAVGIENGYLVYTFDLGSGAALLRSPERLNLSRTVHTLDLGRHRKDGWMKVDNQANVSATTQGELIGLNTYRDLFIGGYDIYEINFLPNELDYQDGFMGCIYDVEIKAGTPADFVAPGNPPGHVDAGLNIGICGSSECDLGGCKNGAECVELGASYVCNCTGEWTGPLCDETLNPCDPGHDPSPLCSEGSTCVLIPEGYACQCQLGRTGQYCDQDITISDPLFQGDTSYMAFGRDMDIKFDTRIAIEFKPQDTTGILFYVANQLHYHSGDFMSISLSKGVVEFRFSLNGHGEPAILRSTTKVDPDNWYRVEITRNNNIGFLRINNDRAFGFAPGESIGLDLETDFFVGGAPSLDKVNPLAVEDEPESFNGCIRLLVINDMEMELTETGALYGLNIGDCDGTACGHNVCKNGGSCTTPPDNDGDFSCQCLQPFAGKTCEDSMYCANHQCSPGGICIPDKLLGTHSCACLLGYDGSTCENVITLSSASFNGDGYFIYRDANYTSADPTVTALSIDFMTTANQGLIMWNGQPITTGNTDYLGVGLENGQLKISINLGPSSIGVIRPTRQVADGNWHSLFIQRSGSFVTIYIDNFAPMNFDLGGRFTGLDTEGLYYFGGLGLDEDLSQLTHGLYSREFVGCIDNIQLRGDLLLDLTEAEEGYNVRSCDNGSR